MEAYKNARSTCGLLCCEKGLSTGAPHLPGVDSSFRSAYLSILVKHEVQENIPWVKPYYRPQKKSNK